MKSFSEQHKNTFTLLFLLLTAFGCEFDSGRSNSYQNPNSSYSYMEEGLDKVIKQNRAVTDFTVLLYDMNYDNGQFLHQYQVITPVDTTFETTTTGWLEVSSDFFQQHENDLGMEVASKTDGVLDKAVAPAGYSQYVGNEKYGRWVERDGTSFWEFYGRYAMLSSVFHMVASPARYGYYNDYNRYYRGRDSYYGPSGYYGTSRYTNTNAGNKTTWAKQPATFKESVRSQVSRSSNPSRTSTGTRTTSNRTSRSGSRYSGSSSRSRGGGGGK
ncbi:MAG: hypothetical protein AAFO07_10235 [Bacteroidota bacterium]